MYVSYIHVLTYYDVICVDVVLAQDEHLERYICDVESIIMYNKYVTYTFHL